MERERKRQKIVKKKKSSLSFVLFGSTGDLSRKKLFPALANLIERFEANVTIYALGRKPMEVSKLLEKQCVNVKDKEKCEREIFPRVKYIRNSCSDPEDFKKLQDVLPKDSDRIFFLALPPSLFGKVTTMISQYCKAKEPYFTRVILEKPFGYDTESFQKLNRETSLAFEEKQLYRIDHYLGKEVIQNMITLRFMNSIFEPIWSSKHIESVHIQWKENLTLEGRGVRTFFLSLNEFAKTPTNKIDNVITQGYFDKSGIVRDVMQNHLLQVLALMTMEKPKQGLQGVVNAKNEVLKCVKTLHPSDVVHGQLKGYVDDPDVPNDSLTSTYCMAHLCIENKRWKDCKFLMSAGKGLDERLCEIRIRFRTIVPLLGCEADLSQNELVIRIQPDPSIYFKIVTKQPGLELRPVSTTLDLTYRDQFADIEFSDAYELCLLRCVRGDRSVFVGSEELVQAWRIFTPILESKSQPEIYEYGSNATMSARKMAFRVLGFHLLPPWNEFVCSRTRNTDDLRALFQEFDKDNSGFITVKEFSRVVRSKFYDNREPPKALIEKYMRRFDSNGDGKISFQEFYECTHGLCCSSK